MKDFFKKYVFIVSAKAAANVASCVADAAKAASNAASCVADAAKAATKAASNAASCVDGAAKAVAKGAAVAIATAVLAIVSGFIMIIGIFLT